MSDKSKTPKKKSSSVRHTRAVQRDRTKRSPAIAPDTQIVERLNEIIHPTTLALVSHFHQQGLRERTLTLPIMMAFVLSFVWRQVSGVSELVRLVQTEALLWVQPLKVSQQALSERLSTLPAQLFGEVFRAVLPHLQARWSARQRPLSPEIAWAQQHYQQVVSVDGSTLDALIRKIGLLQDLARHPLAGKMTAVLDICTRLPCHLWHDADPNTHDQHFWPLIQQALVKGTLAIFDLGYTNFMVFRQLSEQGVTFITRAKTNLAYEVTQVWQNQAAVHDMQVWIGQEETRQQVRLIEVLYQGKWYRYLTNELTPQTLPVAYVVALYWQRWRIEDAYHVVKRLLGLAYFWSGSQNAVELQMWATWLLYAVLIDLTDELAEALKRPFVAISIEMVYRSLYYFTKAQERGAAQDLIPYLAQNAKLLGVVKRKPPPSKLPALLALTSVSDP